MKYNKTDVVAQIIQYSPNSPSVIERRVYRYQNKREFVRVNGIYIELEHYINNTSYKVRRFYSKAVTA